MRKWECGRRKKTKVRRWEGAKVGLVMSGPSVLEERYFVSTLFKERCALGALRLREKDDVH